MMELNVLERSFAFPMQKNGTASVWITNELSKTPWGQARIAAAAQRLDRSVYDMTRDLAQGEKTEEATAVPVVDPPVVVQSADTPPTFLPLDVPVAEDIVVGRVVEDLGTNSGIADAVVNSERNVINADVDGPVSIASLMTIRPLSPVCVTDFPMSRVWMLTLWMLGM